MASILHSVYQWLTCFNASDKSKNHLVINGASFFLVCGVGIEALLVLNVAQSCQDTFDCRTFWPTISYLAAYRGHDRLFNLTMTLLAVMLPLFFLGAHAHYQASTTTATHRLMLACGVLTSLLLPAVALIDEANSSHVAPLEKIHYWLMVSLITCGTTWTILSLQNMSGGGQKTSREAQQDQQFLVKYVLTALMMLVINIVEWTFANSVYSNWLVNENVEALCEWTVISFALFAPYFYSLTFPGFEFTFVVS